MAISYRTHLVGDYVQLACVGQTGTYKRKGDYCFFFSGSASFTVPPALFLTLPCVIRMQSQETSVNLSKGRVLCSRDPVGLSWKTLKESIKEEPKCAQICGLGMETVSWTHHSLCIFRDRLFPWF